MFGGHKEVKNSRDLVKFIIKSTKNYSLVAGDVARANRDIIYVGLILEISAYNLMVILNEGTDNYQGTYLKSLIGSCYSSVEDGNKDVLPNGNMNESYLVINTQRETLVEVVGRNHKTLISPNQLDVKPYQLIGVNKVDDKRSSESGLLEEHKGSWVITINNRDFLGSSMGTGKNNFSLFIYFSKYWAQEASKRFQQQDVRNTYLIEEITNKFIEKFRDGNLFSK